MQVARNILQRHAEISGKTLPAIIDRDAFKRPYIQGANLDFNYTHTKDAIALIAADGPLCTVGIDMELLNREPDVVDILDAAFSAEELQASPMTPLQRWTLKEAALKMYGTGFALADPKEYIITTEEPFFNLYYRGQRLLRGYYKTWTYDGHILTVCSQNDIHALCVCTGMMDKNKEGGL